MNAFYDHETRAHAPSDDRADERATMVTEQLESRDIVDPRVLAAMREVPRHAFVPAAFAGEAYEDGPLPIGYGATISQPYIVALMTQLATIQPGERVLDVGAGSGYQSAVLAAMGAKVWAIEIVEPLVEQARAHLRELGYDVALRAGDGAFGWPDQAPFDAIIVAAAAPRVPDALEDQLAAGGRLVIPVGDGPWQQQLQVVEKTATGARARTVAPVAFVPMTGAVR